MTETYNPYQAPQSDLNDEQDGGFELLDEPNSLSAGSGVSWVGESWQIFKARPLLWIGLLFAYIGFALVMGILSAIPILGFFANVAMGIIIPMLMAGIYYIAYGVENGDDVAFGDVTIAFSQGKFRDFFFLWLWQFLIMLGLVVIIAGLTSVLDISLESTNDPMMTILLLLISLAFIILIAMMSIFSPIFVLFHDLEAWDAMKLSLKGCFKNMLPFLLNGIMFGLLFIVGLITLGLGFFVIAPMMIITIYVAYRQIFLA